MEHARSAHVSIDTFQRVTLLRGPPAVASSGPVGLNATSVALRRKLSTFRPVFTSHSIALPS